MNESRKFYFLQKSFMKKIFLVILLFCLYQENAATEECDFVKCIVGVKNLIFDIKIETDSFSCKKLADIPECSESCIQKYFPSLMLEKNFNQPTFSQFCAENISKRLNVKWPCILQHTFRLLTCFANVSTITTNNVRDDVIHTETCRKIVEFQNCPSEVLLDSCGEESVNVVNDILVFILDHLKPSCKEVNVDELLYMPVHYHLEHNLMQVARSFDDHFLGLTDCFQQLVQDETDLNNFLCGTNDPLSDCIQWSLTRHFKAFPVVRRLVLNFFSLADKKCRTSSLEPKDLSTLNSQKSLQPFTENYKDALSFLHKKDKLSDISESSSKSSSEKSSTFHLKSTETLTVPSLFNKTVKKQTKEKVHQDIQLEDGPSDVNNNEKPTDNLPGKDVPSDVNKNDKQSNKLSEEKDNINYLRASGGVKVFVSRTLLFIIFIFYVFR